jgi:hypothetical protein
MTVFAIGMTQFAAQAQPESRADIAANPPGALPFGVRQRLAAQLEDALSQAIGVQLNLQSIHAYDEQDGTRTNCITGTMGGKRLRITFSDSDKPQINPSAKQWKAAGCLRPNYRLIR